jgi:hypothetical protein
MAESPPALNAAPSPHRPSGPIAAPAELAEAPHRPARLDDQKSERTTTARREDPAPPGKWVFEDD